MRHALLALPLLLGACDKPLPERAETAPRPVRVQPVVFTAPRATLPLSGTVQARRQAELAFRTGGKVVARPVDLGSRVRAGSVIARLDPADLVLSAEGARSAVEAAAAAVGQVVAAGQTVAVVAHTAETEVLVDVPENRLAELRAAEEVAILPWSDPSRSFAGKVREVAARADPGSRTFAVRVSVTGAGIRPPGDRPGSAILGSATPGSDAPGSLPLGGTVTVRFAGPGSGPVAVLPASALADRDGAPAVWVLDAGRGRAVPRLVRVAAYAGDHVALLSGVSPGEQVVTAGVTQLDPDLPVTAWTGAQR